MIKILLIAALGALFVAARRKAQRWNKLRRARLEAFNKAWEVAQVEQARKDP